MSRDEHSKLIGVEALFERWVEHHVLHGERQDPEVLCRDRPDLLEELRAQIRKYGRLEELIDRPPDLPSGRTLLHYRIVEKLGAGGMGDVYAAEDTKLGRRVALKVLPPELAADQERLDRFRREARIIAALNHPNIVTLHSIEEADRRNFLTMELVAGQTLDALVPAQGMEPAKLLEIGRDLATALAAAHEKGVIHRDLKPANVMVSAEGRIKVLDFGLAKLFQTGVAGPGGGSAALATEAGRILGTVAYMSPEQARGEELDARTDLFSLGVILYELATGRRPFRGDSTAEVLGRLQERAPVPPSQINRRLDPRLEAIVLRCLAKGRHERVQSAAELAASLERLSSGSPRISRRWFGAAALTAALAAAGFVATQVAWNPLREAAPSIDSGALVTPETAPASLAVLPFLDASPGEDQEYLSETFAAELRDLLARAPRLRVVGWSFSRLEGTDEDLRVAAEGLDVATILEGTTRAEGDQVEIVARLVRRDDGAELWTAHYDRDIKEIFAVQAEIAESVAGLLGGELVAEGALPAGSRGGGGEAYSAYLQGRYWAAKSGRIGLLRAADLYQEALAAHPDYSMAWLGLSEVYLAMSGQGLLPFAEGYEKAFSAATRALELDDSLAEAWGVLGAIAHTHGWDWRASETAFERALQLAPGNPTVLRRASTLEAILGRFDEAVAFARRAVELDPLNARAHRNLGRCLHVAGRAQEAEAALLESLELDPQARVVRRMLGEVYLQQSRPQAALDQMELETHPFYRTFGLALAYHAVGREEQSRAALSVLVERTADTAAYQIAQVYAFRGEPDQAFDWLERAWATRDPGLPALRVPLFANLHGDPRWEEFLGRMGLAE